MTDTVNEESYLHFAFDMSTERMGLLAHAAEYIEVGRDFAPAVVAFHDAERVLMVTTRGSSSYADKQRALFEVLMLWPAMPNVQTMVMTWHAPEVKQANGTVGPAVCIIALQRAGADCQVFPYTIDDAGKVSYTMDVELSPLQGKPYPQALGHGFAVYAFQYNAIDSNASMIRFLSHKGHEIQFFGDWNVDNLEARTNLFLPPPDKDTPSS